MDLDGKINLLDRTVAIEKSGVRTNAILSVTILIVSLTAAVLIYELSAPILEATTKLVTSICTALTSFLSGIPAMAIPGKRIRIAALCFLKEEYEGVQNNPTKADPQLLSELEKRFWNFFDKNL